MNNTYLPYYFTEKELSDAYGVSAFKYLSSRKGYELKPVYELNAKKIKEQVTQQGFPVHEVYHHGIQVLCPFLFDINNPESNLFYSAIDFLCEYEHMTVQSAIQEVYLSTFGFPKQLNAIFDAAKEKKGTTPEDSYLYLTEEDLKLMDEDHMEQIRPQRVSIQDWSNASNKYKLYLISVYSSQEERDYIARRFNKMIAVVQFIEDYSKFRSPRPVLNGIHVVKFLKDKCGVSDELISWLISKHLLYEDISGNLIAPGYNETGKMAFAYRRSTYDLEDNLGSPMSTIIDRAVENSDPAYSWRYICPKSKTLYVFEDVIDGICYMDLLLRLSKSGDNTYKFLNELRMYSFLFVGHYNEDMYPKTDNPSLRALPIALENILNSNKSITRVYLCFSNDYDKPQNYGQSSAIKLVEALKRRRYISENISLGRHRNFREMLLNYIKCGTIE